jgi:beta-alanine degradation protein BauB
MHVMWKGAAAAAAICAAAAVVGAVQSGAATRREPQFENGEVRVWKSIIQPNQPLAVHRHDHGRTIVVLKGGTLDVVDASGATQKKMNWESGKAYWLDADPPNAQHGDLNRGQEPIEVIVVELKNDQKK